MIVINEQGDTEEIDVVQAFFLASEDDLPFIEKQATPAEIKFFESELLSGKLCVLFRIRSVKGWMMTLEGNYYVDSNPDGWQRKVTRRMIVSARGV